MHWLFVKRKASFSFLFFLLKELRIWYWSLKYYKKGKIIILNLLIGNVACTILMLSWKDYLNYKRIKCFSEQIDSYRWLITFNIVIYCVLKFLWNLKVFFLKTSMIYLSIIEKRRTSKLVFERIFSIGTNLIYGRFCYWV